MKDYEAYEELADTILSSSARKGLVLWSNFPELYLLDTQERSLVKDLISDYGYIYDYDGDGVWSGFSLNDYGRLFITKGGYIGEKIREKELIDYSEIKKSRASYRLSVYSIIIACISILVSTYVLIRCLI